MLELLNKFSLSEILIFIVMLLLALKGLITLGDWFGERGIKFFKRKYSKPKEMEETLLNLTDTIDKLDQKVNILMHSDRDDIKAFLVRQHHYFCYELKQIDYQSLQVIEKRYSHYKEEGGNSYINDLMHDLRSLPKTETIKSQRKLPSE